MAVPWTSIISAGIIPLIKWGIKFAADRKDKRKKEKQELEQEEERKRLRGQTARRIRDAKENYQDIEPSDYDV